MAEAGEVGHCLNKLNESAGETSPRARRVALPIQERHLAELRECALTLAAEEDPYEEESAGGDALLAHLDAVDEPDPAAVRIARGGSVVAVAQAVAVPLLGPLT